MHGRREESNIHHHWTETQQQQQQQQTNMEHAALLVASSSSSYFLQLFYPLPAKHVSSITGDFAARDVIKLLGGYMRVVSHLRSERSLG